MIIALFNTWEDQMVEEGASDWEVFHPRQSMPSLTPSLNGHRSGSA
jgi:hypothetical protein